MPEQCEIERQEFVYNLRIQDTRSFQLMITVAPERSSQLEATEPAPKASWDKLEPIMNESLYGEMFLQHGCIRRLPRMLIKVLSVTLNFPTLKP